MFKVQKMWKRGYNKVPGSQMGLPTPLPNGIVDACSIAYCNDVDYTQRLQVANCCPDTGITLGDVLNVRGSRPPPQFPLIRIAASSKHYATVALVHNWLAPTHHHCQLHPVFNIAVQFCNTCIKMLHSSPKPLGMPLP